MFFVVTSVNKVWRGEYSLPLTFFGFYLAIATALGWLAQSELAAGRDATPIIYIKIIHALGCVIPIWRSGKRTPMIQNGKRTHSKAWAGLAIIIVLSTVYNLFVPPHYHVSH
jgi:hypothetical protein